MSTSCDIQEDKLGTTSPDGVNSSCKKLVRDWRGTRAKAPSTTRLPFPLLLSISCDSPGLRCLNASRNEVNDIGSSFRAYCGYGATSASSISFCRAATSLPASWQISLDFPAEFVTAPREEVWRLRDMHWRNDCDGVRLAGSSML